MLSIRRSLIPLALALSAASVLAQGALTPARYVQCQISAHFATLTGMQERQALVRRQATAAEQRQSDELARARVDRAFSSCGSSVGALGAYAHRNDEQIRAWLQANPAQRAQLQDLQARIASLGAQFGPPQRKAADPQRRER